MKNIHLFKRFILLSFLFLLQLVQGQQYPVQVTPVLIPPYSLKLSDYATTNENKLQLQLLMTDLMEPTHQVRLRFSLESGLNATPIAISNQYINGMRDITLSPGVPLILTNVELRALFQLQNLSGISAADYAKTLPQGQYNFCFEVIDSSTGRTLSRKSCSTAYFVQYDPPMLSLPQNKELVQKQNEIQNIVFQWMPRQIAPNTRYIFTMKEIWDLQRDPVSAFLASPVLWKEEVYSNSLFYGFDKTQLLPGKRYAWQVQAKSGNPVLGGNPTEDNGVYKNNGLSEIFYFDYIQDCKVPSFLSAKNAGRGRVEVRWSYPGEKPNGLYRIQYRKKGSTTAWMEQEAYQEMIYISGLADKTEYEYRVGAVCGLAQTYNNGYENGADNAFSYSNIQYFTTDSEDSSNTVQCGMMPDINITNKAPLQDMLVANDVFTAGDFPVTVIKSEGNGTYTGQGYIVVPYLADTKVKVSFNNIQINTDRQLISGVIETTYDPTESAVHYVSGTVDGIFGDGDVKEINFDYPIDSVYYSATPAPGTITVVGPPGKNGEPGPTQTYEGGRDTTITDPDGNIWEVDKEGNITKGGQVAPGGASNSKNTDGVSGSGKDAVVNQYTAKGIDLTWQKTDATKFDFDTKEQTGLPLSDYETVKDRNGQTIAISYKAVVNGQTDILQADIKITNASLKDSKIIFKTLSSGKNIEATETNVSDTNRRYDLTMKGAYNYQEEDVIAVLMPNDSLAKQQVISSFKLVHLNGKKAKVHLVPLDQKSKGNLTQIRKNLSKVYDAIGVDFEIVDEDILDISNLGIGQNIESGDPKLMSTYGSDQIKINNHYLNTRSKELRYVLFVTDKSSSTGQHGYMRLNGQFGYVFAGAPIKTAAHELGHGIFRLEHPKQNYPKLLMDNSSITGEILSHKDWKQIGDPAFKFYGFQDQSEGEFSGIRLTPDWIPFEYTYGSTHGNSNLCNNNGGICSIVKDNKTYTYKNGDYYNEDISLGINKLPNHTQEVLVVNYLEGCGKLYKVKLTALKASKFSSDSDLDFTNKIFTFVGDIGCEGDDSGSVNGTQSVKSNLTSLKKYFGTDVEFAKDGKVYKLNTKGDVEEVPNPLTDEQINSGEWTENKDYNKRFSSDKNGNLKLQAFGFKSTFKNIDGKIINREIVSENIRNKTNTFLQENNVKDLNTNYSSSTEAFADGSSIKIEGEFGKIVSEGIDVTTVLLKTGEIKNQTYLSDSKATIKAPGLVTGSVEVVAQKVTDITSLGVLVYDVSVDKEVRTGLKNQFSEIKNQVGENPKEFFPILGDVILTVTTGNTPEDWNKSLNSKDNGERSHLATRGVGNAVVTVMAGSAIIKDLPEIADKLGDAVKKAKKSVTNISELVTDIVTKRSRIRNVFDTDAGKAYAKKFFDKFETGDFEDWYQNTFKKYDLGEPLNFEVHHVIPVKVLENNKELQELLLWAKKNGKDFDFNSIDNGIPLQKKSIKFEQSGHANHPKYDEAITEKINDILEKAPSEEKAFERIQNLISDTKGKLEADVLLGNKDVNQIVNF